MVTHERLSWQCDGQDLTIGLDRAGTGPRLLLLPAFSSISTRGELRPLQELLAKSFDTLCIDWPGFGTLPKPKVDWRPEVYDRFLAYMLEEVIPEPFAIIAAGHASGYVLRYLSRHPQLKTRLVLLSPTWRGPLPTMMNGQRGFFRRVVNAIDLPLIGDLLYRLNVNRPVVGMMARGHVYADKTWLSGDRLQEKMAVTCTAGARHASARFVCGQIDPFPSREKQFEAIAPLTLPILNLFSLDAPRKSRLEMQALSQRHGVTGKTMPRGKLSFYEEFPQETVAAILPFLREPLSNA